MKFSDKVCTLSQLSATVFRKLLRGSKLMFREIEGGRRLELKIIHKLMCFAKAQGGQNHF